MNPDFPQNEQAKLEAKLTALLLGELHASEVAKLSKAMEADPELAALYEQLKVTIELVREGAMQPKADQAPLKMSAEKREKLLASFKTVAPKEFARPRRVMDWLVPVAACAAVLVVLATVVLPRVKPKYELQQQVSAGRYWGSSSSANVQPMAPVKSEREANDFDYFQHAGTVPQERAAAARPVPRRPLVLSATKEQVPAAPVLAPPASATPIILPAADGVSAATQPRLDYGRAVALNGRGSEMVTNGFVFGAGVVRSFSDEPAAPATSGVAADSTIVRNGNAIITIDPDTHNLVINADPQTPREMIGVIRNLDRPKNQTTNPEIASLSSTTLSGYVDAGVQWDRRNPAYTFGGADKGEGANDGFNLNVLNGPTNSLAAASYDQAVAEAYPGLAGSNATIYTFANGDQSVADRAPALGDLPAVGRFFRSNSAAAAGGEFYTSLTRDDVGGLRYLTNGVVAQNSPLGQAGGANFYGVDTNTAPARSDSEVLLDSFLSRVPQKGNSTTTSTNGAVAANGEFRRMLSTVYYSVDESNNSRFSSAATAEAVNHAMDLYDQAGKDSNGAVASQPLAVWGSVDGSTNPARVYPNGVTLEEMESDLKGSNSYVIGQSFLALTNSEGRLIAGRRLPTGAPTATEGQSQNSQFTFAARNDGLALNDESGKEGTRGGGGGGRGRGNNQNSVLTTRQFQFGVNYTENFGGGGGGGGGFGGGGRANPNSGPIGGVPALGAEKPVEIAAAAAAPRGSTAGQARLKTVTIKVDPNTFYMGLQNVGAINFGAATNAPAETSKSPSIEVIAGTSTTDASAGRGLRYVTGLDPQTEEQLAVKGFFQAVGVDIDPAKGKSVFFNDRDGTLTVRGTEDDLEMVQQAVNTLSTAPPEVTDKSRFAEVNQNDNKQLGFDWYLGNYVASNKSIAASGGSQPALQGVPSAGNPEGTYQGSVVGGTAVQSPAVGRAKPVREDNIETSQLVQDGKLLYQLGRNEEAEIKLQEAVNRDPNNQGALYYSSLAKQAKDRQLADARNVTSVKRIAQVENGWVDNSARLKLPTPQARTNYIANWWNATPTVRAFYDDNAISKSAITNKITEYAAANDELEHAKFWRQTLELKTRQEETDVSLPQARMVTVMNRATSEDTKERGFGEKVKETLTGKTERVASIQVDQERPDINVNGIQGNMGSGYDPYFLKTEFDKIQSEAVLGKVVKQLNLDGGDPKKTKAAEEKLKKNLDLRSVKNTKFIEIGARSEKPDDAARIANAVAEAYRDYRSEEYEQLKHGGINSLEQQLQEQDQKILVAQAKVDELRKSLGASNASELKTYDRLNELSSQKVQKEAEYNQQKSLLEKLRALNRTDLRKALPIAVADTQLNELLAEHDLAVQKFISLRASDPSHPKTATAQALVDDLDRRIDARAQEVLAGMEAKSASTKTELDNLTQTINNTGQADTALPKPTVPPPTPQPEVLTRENAFSTFSLNVSDVSFKLAAATLEKGQMPEPGSIRSEEFINAFDYRDPDAAAGVPIAFASERARYPFAHNRELLRFSLKTAAAGRQVGRPLNIVLLLDNSGSMERADRVSIIREALRVLAGQLHEGDTFSVVTFARTAQLRVDGIPGNQAGAAAEEIAKLTPEGGTNLGEALDLAYETARHHYLVSGDNRVVLLTDGAANLGDVNADTLKQKVEAQRQQGIALDCFGIGWEGLNDDLLEVLTRNGDGRYGFINTPEEANTEFVAQIAGALHVAASDVKVQVEFNPQRVTLYRQIGYAKHQLTKEQFRDNTVDAAEIAAQEAGNALYTIETDPNGSGSIATVHVRYKVPGTTEYREQAWDVPYTGGAVALDEASPAMRLAATTCAFSEWLATSPFAAEVSTDQLLRYMSGVPQFYGADARPAKLEWMIRQAKSISGK